MRVAEIQIVAAFEDLFRESKSVPIDRNSLHIKISPYCHPKCPLTKRNSLSNYSFSMSLATQMPSPKYIRSSDTNSDIIRLLDTITASPTTGNSGDCSSVRLTRASIPHAIEE
jgi:hypothetical protein